MVAITPNAGNHAGLAAKASRFVNVFDLPWEKTKFPGVEAKTLLLDKETGLLTALIRMAPILNAVLVLNRSLVISIPFG